MSRLLCTLILGAALAVPVAATATAADALPAPDCHGMLVTDKAGDSVNSIDSSLGTGSPSSDLTGGWFTFADGKVTADIQVANLTVGEVDAPYVGLSWEFAFTAGKDQRYVRGFEDVTGMTKFSWGEPRAVTDDQTTPRVAGETTGKLFPGANGVIQIDVPLKDMGIAPGTVFKALALETRQWITFPAAVPTLPPALPIYSVAPIYDNATGKQSFTVGPCTAAPAPSSSAPAVNPSAAAAKLRVKASVGKLSAKKLAKSKSFKVKLTGTASKLTATLRKGAKTVGAGKLAALKGTGTLTVKLKRRLSKGAYKLALAGTNADGAAATTSVSVKVR